MRVHDGMLKDQVCDTKFGLTPVVPSYIGRV